MKLLNTQSTIQKACFACKVNTKNEVLEESEGIQERFKINELVIMENTEYDEFKNDLLNTYEFLEGKGGTSSTTVPQSVTDEGKTNFLQLTEEERNEFQKGAYRKCVGVTTKEAEEMFVIDPQGHSYARYATIIRK